MPGPRDEPPQLQHTDPECRDLATAELEFEQLCAAQTLKGILGHHRRLCAALKLVPGHWPQFYPKLKGSIKSWKAQGLFAKFDKRAAHKCYGQGLACVDSRVLVVGAGPCGLRAAIEAQLLGAHVLVIEKRDRLSRNNVLHLWPMVIHDLKALGAKKFFGKFCAGSIDHISIRQLQCILLKVALLLGVQVCENVTYEGLLEPEDDLTGWRARLSPAHHTAADHQFDVLIGADGKRNTFPCFGRKEFRGKLAIAITANFVNGHSEWEARVDEISGVAFIFNQKFFKDLSAATGIELENIVYYKDDTHYFVMTAKKQSLLARGVILEDRADTASLLAPENISREQLLAYAREAAAFSTEGGLEPLRFARNHYGLEDVAMFDFTSMYAACHASAVQQRRGHSLLLQLVGDSLLEPFWPTGSGCARGFLSCLDAGWQLRSWSDARCSPVQCVAERESVYRLLAQTTPENLSSDLSAYTVDPRTRYPNLNTEAVLPVHVRSLFDTDRPADLTAMLSESTRRPSMNDSQLKRPVYVPIKERVLLRWIVGRVQHRGLEVTQLPEILSSGAVLGALLESYRPELACLLDTDSDIDSVLQLVDIELGVPAPVTPEADERVDPEVAVTYLSQLWDVLHGQPLPSRPRAQDTALAETLLSRRSAVGRDGATDARAVVDTDTLRRQRKRKSEAIKQSRYNPQAKKPTMQALSSKEQFDSKVKDLEAKFSGASQPATDKLLKPVPRVIGRIEKTDWNMQQIEKKIEENSRPLTGRDRDGAGLKAARAAFFDTAGESSANGTGFDVGRRGQNRVSEMAEKFQSRAVAGAVRPVAVRPPPAPATPQVGASCGAPLSDQLRGAASRALHRLKSLVVAGACYYLAAHALALVASDMVEQLRWW